MAEYEVKATLNWTIKDFMQKDEAPIISKQFASKLTPDIRW